MSVTRPCVAAAAAHAAEAFVPPPDGLPYIHSLTFTSLSFLGFASAAAYCNWRQWQVPADAREEEEEDEGGAGASGEMRAGPIVYSHNTYSLH